MSAAALGPSLALPGRARFLHGLNPLSKAVAPLPAMVALVVVRDAATPLAFLLVAIALLLVGARMSRRAVTAVLLGFPIAVAVLTVSFTGWVDPARVDDSAVLLEVGGLQVRAGALQIGLATALRLASLSGLALLGGLTTTGPDLVRALVQQLHVPYRIGWTALAAYRFVPRFAHELAVIRAAHRVRGTVAGRGPVALLRRWLGYVVPLLASAVRHAERVALSMDSRAFGAHPTRTQRYPVPFRARDVVFVVVFWAGTAALLLTLPSSGILTIGVP
ncbi:energy-coupling factor transporter transmembrane protein EcfT [Rathayibacter caricis]|jgi:energy-coupling factor transport system permease protein|uniref:energy-coupling factor transporter transmembrane component T family protein n=1 Tax=Rathayibacter caricis TaxID=110936 RepID=UPI001FB35982|nr:energy-coupling factor transporter transmembrane component T [Rathayibacter caricis]MCJ1695198.1 energy-coupling factor transporter transmembrane protein EcfT [Rathayibacter caricis]